MQEYKGKISIAGKEIRYSVRSRSGLGSIRMKYGPGGLTVIAPESCGSASIEKYLLDNSEWIIDRIASNKGTNVSGEITRTKDEYETLLCTIFKRLYHSSDIFKDNPSGIPSIRFRQMKTVIASYNIDRKELTFTRALTASPKKAITLAAAYGVALLSGIPGSEQFALVLNKICPDWRGIRSALPDSLRSLFSKI